MLRVKPIKSGGPAVGIADYLEHQHRQTPEETPEASAGGRAGYYSHGAAPSQWLGQGAAALGLQGAVGREQLIELLEGRLPDGTDLTTRGGRAEAARMGTDITLSAPKSFSILATRDRRLVDLWDQSVTVATGLIEKEVMAARLGKGGSKGVEHTGSLVVAAYRHEDTRAVDGTADPDLHTHCLALNMTRRLDGEWVRSDLQWGDRMVLGKTADMAQKAWLAQEIQKLGYQIRVTADGFEVDGITDEHVKVFSRRSSEIDEALRARGIDPATATDAQKEAACLATRGQKTQLSDADQAWDWRSRLRDSGCDLDKLMAEAEARADRYAVTPHAGIAGRMAWGNAASPDIATAAVQSAARHIGERETVFDYNKARLEALRAGMGGATLDTVESSIRHGAAGLIAVGDGQFTTREALLREQAILAHVRAGYGQTQSLMTAQAAAAFILEREKTQGFSLTTGQRAALALTLTSSDRVNVIVGAAGAGKTTAMKAAVAAYRDAGHEVIGIGPSAKARDELTSAGADTNHTLASYLSKDHEHNDARLIILDEAGMVSAADMDRLLKKLKAEGGRLLLVGDPQQLAAVEAGSPLAQIIQTRTAAVARVDEIQRQRNAELRAVAQSFADGKADEAVKAARPYMREAHIEAENPKKPTTDERRQGIARDTAAAYLALSPDERARTLVLSGTNAVREQVNSRIRKVLQERGEVSRNEIQITALHKADLTRERAARAESYAPGVVVRLKQGREAVDYTVTRTQGERIILRAKDGQEKRWNPAKEKAQGVYEARVMGLAIGDEIMFRENQGRGADKITNGATGRVTATKDNTVAVTLSDGRKITLDPAQGHSIDYGWCRTIHSSQGATVDRVLVAGEASRVATAESAYVACSRARDALQIITDNPDRLEKSWSKWAERQTALDAARAAPETDLNTLAAARAEAAAELGEAGDLVEARNQAARSRTHCTPTAELEME